MIRADAGYVVLSFDFPKEDVTPSFAYLEENLLPSPVIGWVLRQGKPVPITLQGECNGDKVWGLLFDGYVHIPPEYDCKMKMERDEFISVVLKQWQTSKATARAA